MTEQEPSRTVHVAAALANPVSILGIFFGCGSFFIAIVTGITDPAYGVDIAIISLMVGVLGLMYITLTDSWGDVDV